MLMKNSIRGWKEIFSFTFIQGIKAKSIIISIAIMCVVAFAAVPVISLINGSDDEKKTETSISEVKVVDMTGLDLVKDMEVLKSDKLYDEDEEKIYTDINYSKADIDMNSFTDDRKLKDIYTFEKDSKTVYMQISYTEDSFGIEVVYSGESKVSDKDLEDYNDFVEKNFRKVLVQNMNVDADDVKVVDSVNTITYRQIGEDGKTIDENGEDTSKTDESAAKKDYSHSKYNIIYAMLMLVLFVLAFCGERIAMSIITEKSSKVMEYLMTSIKPMAIVVGKILANLLILLIQIGSVIISFGLSLVVNGVLTGKDGNMNIPSYITDIFSKGNFSGSNIFTFIVAILIIICGFIFYGLIAALAGASVSKMEEMSEGVKMYTILLIIGAYIAMFLMMQGGYKDSSTLKYVVMMIPLTSIFIAPASLATGYLSLTAGIGSLVIMIIAIVLLVKFVANVYESMIYYNGAALKVKDIINISKQNKKKTENGRAK